MTSFADSSALVKLYADELGADRVRSLGDGLLISELARVEVPAALWRKHRTGEMSASDVAVLVAEFEYDCFGDERHTTSSTRFVRITVTSSIVDEAATLTGRYGLRAYDAVQLASAIAARRVDASVIAFAAFDRHLNRAAAIESFQLLPQE